MKTTMTRQEWIEMAERNVSWAREYRASGEIEDSDTCYRVASEAYRMAGETSWALFYRGMIGR